MSLSFVDLDFIRPPDMEYHVDKVFNGEYEIAFDLERPVILDIGANVGAFALWAAKRWPDSTIHSYEPVPESFNYLKRNVLVNGMDERIFVHNHAIAKCDHVTADLYLGKFNSGEATFFKDLPTASDISISVRVEDPNTLPEANILKIDTEGSEPYILTPLMFYQRKFDLILIEYHREKDRKHIDQLLHEYTLVGSSVTEPGLGLLKYINNKYINKTAGGTNE